MKAIDSIINKTKAEQVYRRLKSSILKGDIHPGEKLVINKLAEHFQTSIIPVREALSRLEAESMVTVVAHTGVYVKGIDIEQLRELYPVRGVLEGYAARLATEHITPDDLKFLNLHICKMDEAIAAKDDALMGKLNIEFHKRIYAMSGNRTLTNLIDDMWQKTFFARLVFKFTPYRAKDSNKEHRMIVEELKKGNAKRVETLIIRQSTKTLKLLNKYMEKKEQDDLRHASQQ